MSGLTGFDPHGRGAVVTIHTLMTADLNASVAAGQPLARFGEPEEVAAMVGFIVTEATFPTGSEFVLDGGATAGMALTVPASTACLPC
ncbi:hypothetical protein [Nocardia sp. NBC_01730]|uniref:hypothetical protein n=1 Tax=Nocardia sp. NBC_01730 TaxID=2975998 RepID=UPI002E0DB3DB